jgi:hypothetical protein
MMKKLIYKLRKNRLIPKKKLSSIRIIMALMMLKNLRKNSQLILNKNPDRKNNLMMI